MSKNSKIEYKVICNLIDYTTTSGYMTTGFKLIEHTDSKISTNENNPILSLYKTLIGSMDSISDDFINDYYQDPDLYTLKLIWTGSFLKFKQMAYQNRDPSFTVRILDVKDHSYKHMMKIYELFNHHKKTKEYNLKYVFK
jgi:hypothetical protein